MYTGIKSTSHANLIHELNSFEEKNEKKIHIEETSIFYVPATGTYEAIIRYTEKVYML